MAPRFRFVLGWLLATAVAAATEIRTFSAATLEKLGAAIHRQDICVTQAKNLLRAQKLDATREQVVGWIADGEPVITRVRFIREKNGRLDVFRDVNFGGKTGPSLVLPAISELSAQELAKFHAHRLAEASIGRPASDTHHIVVLSDPETDGWLAYALAATSQQDEVMMGGHFRFTLSQDGQTLRQRDTLYADFTSMNAIAPARTSSYDPAMGVLKINTLVSDLPLETHVYLSLLRKVDLVVSTRNSSLWRIHEGKITRVD
jgi:hypothetical protein